MAANTNPIFPNVPTVAWSGNITAANTAKDGTGTTLLIHTAGSNGSRLDTIKCRAAGTNTASVVRIFINNGSTPGTAANNALYMERSLPATTLTEVAELTDLEIPMNLNLPAGYRVYVCIGTAVAAGWQFTGVGGNY